MELEEIKKLNIYERLSLITEEIGVVEKGLNVQVTKTSSYKAVSERDILDAVKPIEKKYRVYSYPVKREVIDRDILTTKTDYGEKNTLFMRIETTYRFVNIDNPSEYIETTVYGDGLDTGDKAPGKASTYADKYALMKAYKISTGDDPDKEASPEKGYTRTNTDKISAGNINILQNLIKSLPEAKAFYDNILSVYKITDLAQLTNRQYGEILIEIKKVKGE